MSCPAHRMKERRLITFRTLKKYCNNWNFFICENRSNRYKRCNAKNCPIWKRLRKEDSDE